MLLPMDHTHKTLIISVIAFLLFWTGACITISDFNHTERDRSITCTNAGGTYNDEGGCDFK